MSLRDRVKSSGDGRILRSRICPSSSFSYLNDMVLILILSPGMEMRKKTASRRKHIYLAEGYNFMFSHISLSCCRLRVSASCMSCRIRKWPSDSPCSFKRQQNFGFTLTSQPIVPTRQPERIVCWEGNAIDLLLKLRQLRTYSLASSQGISKEPTDMAVSIQYLVPTKTCYTAISSSARIMDNTYKRKKK